MELKSFFENLFLQGVSEILSFVNIWPNYDAFVQIFCNFWPNFRQFWLKNGKIFNCSGIGFIIKDRWGWPKCLILVFWVEFKLHVTNIICFSTKNGQICFLRPLFLKLLEVDTWKLRAYFLSAQKITCTPTGFKSFLKLQFCKFFAKLNSIIIQIALFIFDILKNFV